ncbi:MAG: hypothetical protein ABIH76_04015 [Candidatus Bathyarchaeota archaeon]
MIKSCDVGSMPLEGDQDKFVEEARSPTSSYFTEKIIQGLIDKVNSGIDIPTYPQYRDMNEMFSEMIDGAVKTEGGYRIEGELSPKLRQSHIAEIDTLRLNSKKLSEKLSGTVGIRMCITGPYTFSSIFTYQGSELFTILAELLAKIVRENIFKDKHAEVCFLSLDEPLLGVVDDPRLDFGSEGRDLLVEAWETIFYEAKSRGLETSIHLHNTGQDLFWQVGSLGVIESHVDDPFYTSSQAKKTLEETDKHVKASISTTNFDKLIEQSIKKSSSQATSAEEMVGEYWKGIKRGEINPTSLFEDTPLIEKRLKKTIEHFGVERVLYAGPECGLKGFPNYGCALEYLKHTSQAIKNVNKQLAGS